MHFILALLFPLTAVHILGQRAPFLGLGQRVAFLGGDRELPVRISMYLHRKMRCLCFCCCHLETRWDKGCFGFSETLSAGCCWLLEPKNACMIHYQRNAFLDVRTSVEAWGRVNSRMPVGMHEWSTLLPSGTCPEARPQRTLFVSIDMHTSVEAWGRDSSRMPVGMHEWSTLLPSATCPEARRQCKSRRQTIPNTRGAERLPFPTASVPSNSY